MAQINGHLEEFEEDGQHLPSLEDDDEMEMHSVETCILNKVNRVLAEKEDGFT